MAVDTSYTKVLLHFNGANDSVLVDDFGGNKSWTCNGSACLKTPHKYFGKAALYLDGVNSYVSTGTHNDFTVAAIPTPVKFSFDFWIKFPTFPEYNEYVVFSKYQDSTTYWYFSLRDAGTKTWRFRYVQDGVTCIDSEVAVSLSLNTWYHVAVAYFGLVIGSPAVDVSKLSVATDGIVTNNDVGCYDLEANTGDFEIGRLGSGVRYANCYLDEFRFINGGSIFPALPPANITPPTSAYVRGGVDDEYTVGLLHFNGADASTTFTDSVGNSWTAVGGVEISQTTYELGNASARVEAAAGLKIDSLSSYTKLHMLCHDQFCVDFWVRYVTLPTTDKLGILFGWMPTSPSNLFQNRFVTLNNDSDSYSIHFGSFGGNPTVKLADISISTGVWYHIAIIKNGGDMSLYFNGTLMGTEDISSAIEVMDTPAEYASGVFIGRAGLADSYSLFCPYVDFYMDELRLSNDTIRFNEDFTPDGVNEYGTTSYTMTWPTETVDVSADFNDNMPVVSESADAQGILTGGFQLSVDCAETAVASDTMEAVWYWEKTNEESVELTDPLAFGFALSSEDGMGVTDVASGGWVKTISDGIFSFDYAKSGWLVSVLDTVAASDAATWKLGLLIYDYITAKDSQVNNWDGVETVASALFALDTTSVGWEKLIEESVTFTDAVRLQLVIELLELIRSEDVLQNLGSFVHTVEDVVTIIDSLSRAIHVLADDTIGAADAATYFLTCFPTLAESIALTESLTDINQINKLIEESLVGTDAVSNLAVLYSSLIEAINLGEIVDLDGEVYECWVLNTPEFMPSVYSGFNFNSYCVFENRAYAANSTGIFELTGTTDNGSTINTGVIFSETSFGLPNRKRMMKAVLGVTGTTPMLVLETEDGTRKVFEADDDGEINGSRDVVGRRWKLSTLNFDTLDFIKIMPVVLTR